jgi:hypothetical protein
MKDSGKKLLTAGCQRDIVAALTGWKTLFEQQGVLTVQVTIHCI